ncbi:unnamed protein product, partial [Symbiodinium microadriaticum]
VLVPSAIIQHDLANESIANGVISGLSFFIFCLMGYLTGAYLPVIKPLQCIILAWNPFLRDENFILKLQKAVLEHVRETSGSSLEVSSARLHEDLPKDSLQSSRRVSLRRRRQQQHEETEKSNYAKVNAAREVQGSSPLDDRPAEVRTGASDTDWSADQAKLLFALENFDVERVFDENVFLRLARAYPLVYLQVVGHSLVMTEMIAVLTPAVAIGLQWIFALCPGTVSEGMFGLLSMFYDCVVHQECHADMHCIHHVTNTAIGDVILETTISG